MQRIKEEKKRISEKKRRGLGSKEVGEIGKWGTAAGRDEENKKRRGEET